jgi:hypothetical protein
MGNLVINICLPSVSIVVGQEVLPCVFYPIPYLNLKLNRTFNWIQTQRYEIMLNIHHHSMNFLLFFINISLKERMPKKETIPLGSPLAYKDFFKEVQQFIISAFHHFIISAFAIPKYLCSEKYLEKSINYYI